MRRCGWVPKSSIMVVENFGQRNIYLFFNVESKSAMTRPGPTQPDPAVTHPVTLSERLYLGNYQSQRKCSPDIKVSKFDLIHRVKFWNRFVFQFFRYGYFSEGIYFSVFLDYLLMHIKLTNFENGFRKLFYSKFDQNMYIFIFPIL